MTFTSDTERRSDGGYSPNKIVSDTNSWCSSAGSLGSSGRGGMGVEDLVVTLSTPVKVTGFQLGQADGMTYNPRDYTVTGTQEDGTVCTLYEAKDFDFESSGQVVKHSMIESPKCGEPGIIHFSISLSVESTRVNRLTDVNFAQTQFC